MEEGGRAWAEMLSAAAARAARVARPLIGFVRPDLGRDLGRRARAADELTARGRSRAGGDGARPLVWLHGASAGELLGAAPVVESLDGMIPHDLVVTYTSPSAANVLHHLDPWFAAVAPLEIPDDLDRAMAALRPVLLVFAKLDVWPGLAAAARRAGVPAALLNGVVRPRSRRLRGAARRLLSGSYASLCAAAAASPADGERLLRLGVRSDALRVTGDAAFDLARTRADRARRAGAAAERFRSALPHPPPGGARLVAGSTGRSDETALLAALAGSRRRGGRPGWQVIIAPHEPREARVRRLVGECRRRGLPATTYGRLREGGGDSFPAAGAVVFDEFGALAELYTVADAAYVGGGLDGKGLHNVLEPAAAGVPVLFGPRHDREDARSLVEAGGALTAGPEALGEALERLADGEARRSIGRAARAWVEEGTGAAEETARMLAILLER